MSRLGRLRRVLASQLIRLKPSPPLPDPPDDYVDPRSVMATRSLEQLCETAETYFSRLESWDEHLAKPFARIDDLPQLLINFGLTVQGMDLAPGMIVLDFAAGSGWASRIFTQLGCRVVSVDVSPSALAIGRELYKRLPVIGTRPEPTFVVFDGKTLDIPDASIDRIFCFDAFHHVPNQQAVLKEMARVLAPGGIAAFAEPGPCHSRSPQSQFEMKTFGVLEADVHIEQILLMARDAGFTDMKLLIHHVPPYYASLDEFHSFLAGGERSVDYLDFVRHFNQNVRNFVLCKGTPVPDSRRAAGLRGEISVSVKSEKVAAGEPVIAKARVTNSGTATWLPSSTDVGGVSLGVHLYSADGTLLNLDYHWESLSRDESIRPGSSVDLELAIPAPGAGSYILELDLVSNHVCWFAQAGAAEAVRVAIEVGS